MDRSHGRVQVHEKIIHALALTTLPDNTYDDDNNGGPLKPGFYFYKWMMLGPPLQLPIAETYLCHRRGGVTCLRTDPTMVNRSKRLFYCCCGPHLVTTRALSTCFLIPFSKSFLYISFLQTILPFPSITYSTLTIYPLLLYYLPCLLSSTGIHHQANPSTYSREPDSGYPQPCTRSR